MEAWLERKLCKNPHSGKTRAGKQLLISKQAVQWGSVSVQKKVAPSGLFLLWSCPALNKGHVSQSFNLKDLNHDWKASSLSNGEKYPHSSKVSMTKDRFPYRWDQEKQLSIKDNPLDIPLKWNWRSAKAKTRREKWIVSVILRSSSLEILFYKVSAVCDFETLMI